ncbi:hypothetical protein AVEN_86221-1 [Araneus ventricosus]|uniref:Uncharacterized protein n=1 Tax=Araneus ventricosus TaxID=182803 RepID=A0A4Y2PRE9_ARAVE|nr:hypothetical protein AVEN_86221-1 [Araneus ventricosus]
MAEKRVLQEAKRMIPDLGDKTKLLENTRNLDPSLLGAEISRTFERFLCDVGKGQENPTIGDVTNQHRGLLYLGGVASPRCTNFYIVVLGERRLEWAGGYSGPPSVSRARLYQLIILPTVQP